jgi:hypothetical protein
MIEQVTEWTQVDEMPRGRELLTHSRMACFKTCPRKHYFKYLLGLRRARVAKTLHFGQMVHAGIDLIAKGRPLQAVGAFLRQQYREPPAWCQSEEDVAAWQLEGEQVIRLVFGYEWRWRGDTSVVISSETRFELPIPGCRVYRVAGLIDKVVAQEPVVFIREHKTTGDQISVDSDYWKRVRIDTQISLYLWAARVMGWEAREIEYDVLHKPGIAPKKLTKAEQVVFKCERETLEMYGKRLTDDIGSRPDFYFARQRVQRLDSEITEFLDELRMIARAMRDAELRGRHFRNTDACQHPYRCEYLDICHGNIDLSAGVPEGFEIVDYVHEELLNGRESDATNGSAAGDAGHAATPAAVRSDGNAANRTEVQPGEAGCAAAQAGADGG